VNWRRLILRGVPHPRAIGVDDLHLDFHQNLPFSTSLSRLDCFRRRGAFACGLIALVVSRGSSLIWKDGGIQKHRKKWENALASLPLCLRNVAWLQRFMWSQSVIVEVYPLSFFR